VPLLTLDEIHALARRALVGSGAAEPAALTVAESIRDAEAEGIRNVGLGYLPIYCEHLRCGKVDGSANPTWSTTAEAVLLVDAAHGFAHHAFTVAFEPFVELVARRGVATMAITRSYSAGVVGWFVDRLARRGLVALAFANSSALMPPWGGTEAVFGTNPIGFAAPRAAEEPVVLDMSTSATARVNVLDAVAAGGPIPAGWALDATGRPTTDPEAARDGMMAPLGGAKGAGLALLVDVLAGALTGSNLSHESSSFGGNEGGPPGVGQLFVAFAPGAFVPAGGLATSFGDRVERLAAVIESQPGARLPGSRRHERRAHAEQAGVDVPIDLIEQLEGYCS
jgi:(2R)-3-sulfolactate dehydrogenase (NADP+)